MKRLFSFLGFVLSFAVTFAQVPKVPQWLGAPNTSLQVRGDIGIDSALGLPIRDTNFQPKFPPPSMLNRPGVMVIRPADWKVYVFDTVGVDHWKLVEGAEETITGILGIRQTKVGSVITTENKGRAFVTVGDMRTYTGDIYRDWVFRVSDASGVRDYRVDTLDNSSADDGVLTIVNTAGGRPADHARLKLQFSGPIDARWYGTDSRKTNNQAELLAAVTAASTAPVKVVLLAGGSYAITANLVIPDNVTLRVQPGSMLTATSLRTVSGGIIDGEPREQIANENINLRPSACAAGYFSIMWHGAKPGVSGSTTIPLLQKSADDCILAGINKLYWPKGNWNISKALILKKDANADGQNEFFGLTLFGERPTYGDQVSETSVNVTSGTTAGIIVQRAKGLFIEYITGLGINTNIQNLGSTRKWCEAWVDADWINGYRDNPRTPYVFISIDGLGTTALPSGDRYPDFTALSTDASNAGSTDITIDHCFIRYFVGGIAISSPGLPQNGDIITISNLWVEYCKFGISTGQSQNRSIYCKNIKCWGGVETLFDTYRYGDGTSNPVEVDGCNIAGGVRYLCRLSGFGNSHGMSIRNLHAELLTSLGGSFDNDNGELTITDTWIQFTGANQFDGDGTVTHHPKTIFRGSKLIVTGGTHGTWYSSGFGPLVYAAKNATFDNMSFDTYPLNNNMTGQSQYKHCTSGIFSFGEGERIDWIQPGVFPTEAPIFVTDMSFVTKLFTRDIYASVTRRKINRTTGYQGYGYKDAQQIPLGSVTVSSVQNPDPVNGYSSCQATFSTSSDEFKFIQPGDVVLTYSTDEFGRANVYHTFGTVVSKNAGTGVVIFRDLPIDITATAYPLFLYKVHRLAMVFATGNITSGSPVIASVLIEDAATQFPSNILINSPYFPEGTVMLSYNSGTGEITCSNNATATKTNIDIISSDWQGWVYSGPPNPAQVDHVGWKAGDVAWNVRQDIENNVIFWLCSKSGITNTARQPEFRPVFKQQPPQLADNTTADTYGVTWYYNTTSSVHRIKNGATWYDVPIAGGFANPMTGVGDLIRGGTSGAATRLPAGTDGYLLRTHGTSGAPTWDDVYSFGTFTPTLYNVTNTAASTAHVCNWLRVGPIVIVSGTLTIDPTTASTLTQVGISLPIASTFSGSGDLAGTAVVPGVQGLSAAIIADNVNSRAEINFIHTDVANNTFHFTFMYYITAP